MSDRAFDRVFDHEFHRLIDQGVTATAYEIIDLKTQLKEALSIINDLDEYSEDVGEWHEHERIDVLRLKQ